MRRVPMTLAGAAAMARGAVAVDGMTVAVMAGADALAVNRCAAGAAGVGITAAGRTMTVARLAGGRSEDGKTGGDGQQGNDLFHDEGGLCFDLWPHPCGVFIRRGVAACIRDSAKTFFPELNHTDDTMPNTKNIIM